jgi:hypothetical protein
MKALRTASSPGFRYLPIHATLSNPRDIMERVTTGRVQHAIHHQPLSDRRLVLRRLFHRRRLGGCGGASRAHLVRGLSARAKSLQLHCAIVAGVAPRRRASRPRHIRVREIVALEQKLGAVRFGAGAAQAIAEIQAGAVFAALAVALERGDRAPWAKMSGNSACRKANCDIAKSRPCLTPPTRGLPNARRSSSAIPG